MKVLGSALAAAVTLAAGAVAQAAEITSVSGFGRTQVAFRDTPGGPFIVNSDLAGQGVATGFSGASSYDAHAIVGEGGVLFRSGSSVVGEYVNTLSESGLLISVKNTTSETLTGLQLKSTIIPAAIGFYIADRSTGCSGDPLLGCPQTRDYGFSDFDVSGLAQGTALLGTVGYTFEVRTDLGVAHFQDGRFSLFEDINGGVTALTDLDDLQNLNGFQVRSSDPALGGDLSNLSAFGYAWDATDILIPLGDLAPGQTRFITYRARVQAAVQTGCIEDKYCLGAYGGFGDPIGRGGGIDHFRASAFDGLDAPQDDITGISFRDVRYGPLALNGSTLEFSRVSSGAVPEPSTWAMMILGFGAAGVAIRRRRTYAPI